MAKATNRGEVQIVSGKGGYLRQTLRTDPPPTRAELIEWLRELLARCEQFDRYCADVDAAESAHVG